jgi:flagellar motor switch protein FliM
MNMNEQDNLLTSEEMNALLPEAADQAATEREKKNRAVPYNFRRPDRWSKEQIRGLYLLHDLFAQSLSSALPLHLHTMVEVNLLSVEQNPFSEYLRGLTDPATLFTVSVEPAGGKFVVDLSPSIAFPIIDRMLGGPGAAKDNENKTATDLEMRILEGLVGTVVKEYGAAWEPLIKTKAAITGRETRPQMLQIVAPNEIVVIASYQLQVGEARGTMSFCLPFVMLEPAIDKFNQLSYSNSTAPDPAATLSLLKVLSTVRLPVTAELTKTPAAVSDLATLAIGDVIRTNHRVDRAINVKVGGLAKFAGTVASFDGQMVIQVSKRTEPKNSNNA